MAQFIPDVSDEDVERILKRDFPVGMRGDLRQMIEDVRVREKHRVVLACKKNAGGNVQKLMNNLVS